MKLCEINPVVAEADLFFSEKAPTASPLEWYAVHVKSRHEFVAFHELCEKGIESFLPTARRVSQWKDRKKIVEFPLFPGYLFVQSLPGAEAFLEVLKTRGVLAFVSLEPGRPTPIVADEIKSLRLLIGSGKEIDVYPHLTEGTRVRLKSGPLKNAEGILAGKENNYLFQVNVELLGRSVAVKISAQELEAA